jgi:hypothetical protein
MWEQNKTNPFHFPHKSAVKTPSSDFEKVVKQ